MSESEPPPPVEQTQGAKLLYVCAFCNGRIGMDERARFVLIHLTDPLPYADLITQLAFDVQYPNRERPTPSVEAHGTLCRRCSERIAKIVESIRSTVLSRTGQSS